MLSWALLFISFSASKAEPLDPNQVYNTGNLVLPTPYGGPTPWVNGVYQNELTCWAFGLFGYCGPNPIVRPGNNINFSYGWTDLYQSQSIANVLPNSGTGLRVNGYNFGFQAKNGNGWDDGRTDVLYAYVQFNKPDGSLLLNHTHNLTYQFNWTQFNYNHNFSTPYLAKDIGTFRYGFVGKDNNFWAGPYGPEINNVSFSLKYSVDPCTVNVLSSPSCPGYLEALAKLNKPAPAPVSEPITTTSLPVVNSSSTANTYSLITTNPGQAKQNTTPAPTTSVNNTNITTPSLNTILGIVRAEQSRITAVETSTVQQANESATTASVQAQQTAERVASLASSSSGTGLGLSAGPAVSYTLLQAPGQGSVISSEVSLVGPNPIKDQIDNALQNQQNQVQENQNQKQIEVKRNVQDNDAAAGVSIAMLAKQPPGFELYSIGMRENNFYPPKEIYREQRVVDNERVLRQLNNRSDRLHQEMVNEQYKN